jgi:hypothetical protein
MFDGHKLWSFLSLFTFINVTFSEKHEDTFFERTNMTWLSFVLSSCFGRFWQLRSPSIKFNNNCDIIIKIGGFLTRLWGTNIQKMNQISPEVSEKKAYLGETCVE